MRVVLASASLRRQELIKYIFSDYIALPADIDEVIPENINALAAPEYLAVQKALSVRENNKDSLVIGCDTCVIIDGEIFGKPKDNDDSKRMLSALSGKIHKVITGCCLCFGDRTCSFSETTEVEFYPLTNSEIDEYIKTGEPSDKAGAYGIQGYGSLLIKRINGDYFNVVGLPAARLKREIAKFCPESLAL